MNRKNNFSADSPDYRIQFCVALQMVLFKKKEEVIIGTFDTNAGWDGILFTLFPGFELNSSGKVDNRGREVAFFEEAVGSAFRAGDVRFIRHDVIKVLPFDETGSDQPVVDIGFFFIERSSLAGIGKKESVLLVSFSRAIIEMNEVAGGRRPLRASVANERGLQEQRAML